MHLGMPPDGNPTDGQVYPQPPQFAALVWKSTHEVGFALGQAASTDDNRGAQVPLGAPVEVLEHPMHIPDEDAARPHAVLQQTLSTQEFDLHSLAVPQPEPGFFFAMQIPPEPVQ